MKWWVAACLPVVGMVVGATQADAKWPNDRVMTIVQPFTAGTGSDLVARLIADALSKRWGNTIIVDARSGAAGTIAQNYVAKSKPDGYTFILTTPSPAANAMLIYPSLPYNPMTDFTFIMRINQDALVLFAGPHLQANNLAGFAAFAKANPGKIQIGNPGYGTYAHMTQLKLQDMLGTTFNILPYKGGPQMVTDLLSKQIDAVMDLTGGYLPQVQAGNLRVLAVFGDERDPRLPDVPTAAQQGVNLSVEAWYGLEGPKGLPADVVTQMNTAVTDILLHDDNVRSKMIGIGVTPAPSTPAEFEAIVKAEPDKWRAIVTKYDIKAQ